MRAVEELFAAVTPLSNSHVIVHGTFARPGRKELMDLAALAVGAPPTQSYWTLVRCTVPDRPQELSADGTANGVSEEENRNAPSAAAVFAHLNRAFALGQATVIVWGGMAYRIHAYAQQQQLASPWAQTRLVDLQPAVAKHFDLKTSQCKDPRSVLKLLFPEAEVDYTTRGSLPLARAMKLLVEALIAGGWNPASTPGAVLDGSGFGKETEELRVEGWEQLRERQNNLGIERRPMPATTPAFIVLDSEHVSLRHERFIRLIEVALVVAHRTANDHYGLTGDFTSLVQLKEVAQTYSRPWEITAIDPEAVRRAPPLAQVMAQMTQAAPWESGVLVTWGPDDARVITQNCARFGVASPITHIPLIDLQRSFTRYYEMEHSQISLQRAVSLLAIDTNGLDLHRALADTQVTWYVLKRMLADGWTPHWRPGAAYRRR